MHVFIHKMHKTTPSDFNGFPSLVFASGKLQQMSAWLGASEIHLLLLLFSKQVRLQEELV